MIGFCKYRSIAVNLICFSVLIIGTESCGISESVVVPLSEMKIEDKRFLDTNSLATTFYFGLFNTDGFDRYSGTVFQDMMYRMTSEQSVKNIDKPIEYFEGIVQKKGLHTIYRLNGIYRSEPNLKRVLADEDSIMPSDSIAFLASSFKDSEQNQSELPGMSQPLMKEELKANNTRQIVSPKKISQLDDRLIIIACFREDYFERYMLKQFENELSDIDFYYAKGWVRVYLTDFPGYKIFEAKEVFPDAWRAYYGE